MNSFQTKREQKEKIEFFSSEYIGKKNIILLGNWGKRTVNWIGVDEIMKRGKKRESVKSAMHRLGSRGRWVVLFDFFFLLVSVTIFCQVHSWLSLCLLSRVHIGLPITHRATSHRGRPGDSHGEVMGKTTAQWSLHASLSKSWKWSNWWFHIIWCICLQTIHTGRVWPCIDIIPVPVL